MSDLTSAAGSRLEKWLDEECRNMTIALSLTPDRPSSEAIEMVAEFRRAMTHSYRGQRLLLADQFDELWKTIPKWMRWPVETITRILDRFSV